MADDLSDMIQGFVEESHEAFDDIENDLLTIESNPDDLSIVNGIFRVMHTIKGTAGFLNLDDIGKLSHKIESIFDMIRREELKITSELMDTLLPSIDLLKLMVFELLEEKRSSYNLESTLDVLQKLSRVETPSIVPPREKAPISVKTVDREGEGAPPPFLPSQMNAEFVIEAEEHLETIEQNLLVLEQNPSDNNSINEVFRAIHSIKGTSDYVNLTTITRLSHKLETVFDQIRKGVQSYDNQLADVVLKGIDVLRTLVFMQKNEDTETTIEIDDLLEQLGNRILPKNRASIPPTQESHSSVSSEAFKNISTQQILVIEHLGKHFINNKLEPDEQVVLLRSIKTLRDSATNIGLSSIVSLTNQLDEIVNSVISKDSSLNNIDSVFIEVCRELSTEIDTINGASGEEFKKIVSASVPQKRDISEIIKRSNNKSNAAEEIESGLGQGMQLQPVLKDGTIKTMRVDSSRLDNFMNLIGELIITRNSLSHTLSELSEEKIQPDLMRELKSLETNFTRISEDLQTTLYDVRLIPVKSVFQKIPRIVRDISRKKGKKIQLQMMGENTEIDKSIIEMIGDPLVHIVRNCCDHGIEPSEERLKAGKPETGNIILKASHLGNAIAIDIIDDGAGINTSRVLQIAIEKGLISQEKAQTLDRKSVNSFIFHPGFSTADEVSDISGRGVGMDVVITNIKKIHGTVDVESDEGQGTQVRLLLPLTLAVIDALLIMDNNQKFAVPLESVKETVEIRESDLQSLKQKEAISLRGDIIGVSRLSNLLELERDSSTKDNVLSVVFLEVASKTIGVIVDDLANQQEIVVKPLQRFLANIPGISGSTILGNGEIILILDPAELIELASQ